MSKPEREKRFVWLDVETTGLEPGDGLLLEVAWWRSKSPHPLDLEAEPRSYVIHVPGADLGSALSAVTWEMHGRSGLLADVAKSTFSKRDVESYLAIALSPYYQWHLAGNSVHFDRDWLRVHMPDVAARVHHRILDVSSIGLAAQAMGLVEARPEPAHRALDDVKASIAQYRRQLEWISRRNALGVEPPYETPSGAV